jgi:hypothetical protein
MPNGAAPVVEQTRFISIRLALGSPFLALCGPLKGLGALGLGYGFEALGQALEGADACAVLAASESARASAVIFHGIGTPLRG